MLRKEAVHQKALGRIPGAYQVQGVFVIAQEIPDVGLGSEVPQDQQARWQHQSMKPAISHRGSRLDGRWCPEYRWVIPPGSCPRVLCEAHGSRYQAQPCPGDHDSDRAGDALTHWGEALGGYSGRD